MTPPFTPAPSGAPMLLHRAALLAQGYSDNHIRRALREGELTAVSPGVYLREPDARGLGAAAQHRVTAQALASRLAGDPVVSHVSAAVLHGLPFVYSEMPPVHITRNGAAKSRRRSGLLAHRGSLTDDEITVLGGLPVTTAARTVVDCALLLPFANAVVLTDAALHRRQVTKAGLAEQLRRHPRVPGMRSAAAVVGFADGRSAGAGESYSRVLLHRAGLPPPEVRLPLFDVAGNPLREATFGYSRQRVLGEFEARPGPLPAELRDRDERLLEAGWQVLRWTWTDLYSPAALAARFTQALGIPMPEAPPSMSGDVTVRRQ